VRSVEFVRVEYDLERAVDGVLRSELPDEFAEQLRAGGAPTPVKVTEHFWVTKEASSGEDQGSLSVHTELG
jgi:hypothetical protein